MDAEEGHEDAQPTARRSLLSRVTYMPPAALEIMANKVDEVDEDDADDNSGTDSVWAAVANDWTKS